jgi:hypothetical protein
MPETVAHRKGGHADVAIGVDHSRFYLMHHDPASVARQPVDAVDAILDVDLPGAQHMLRHAVETFRSVNLDRRLPAQYPRREDEVRIACGVIGMQVCQENRL